MNDPRRFVWNALFKRTVFGCNNVFIRNCDSCSTCSNLIGSEWLAQTLGHF